MEQRLKVTENFSKTEPCLESPPLLPSLPPFSAPEKIQPLLVFIVQMCQPRCFKAVTVTESEKRRTARVPNISFYIFISTEEHNLNLVCPGSFQGIAAPQKLNWKLDWKDLEVEKSHLGGNQKPRTLKAYAGSLGLDTAVFQTTQEFTWIDFISLYYTNNRRVKDMHNYLVLPP